MKAVTNSRTRPLIRSIRSLSLLSIGAAILSLNSPAVHADQGPRASRVTVNLSEWKVQATPARVPPGPVEFEVTNGRMRDRSHGFLFVNWEKSSGERTSL